MTAIVDHTAPEHLAALAASPTKKARIHYACAQLGNPTTAEVLTWLTRHGETVSRPTTSTVVTAWKRERGLSDTADLPALSDGDLAELDCERRSNSEQTDRTAKEHEPTVWDVSATDIGTKPNNSIEHNHRSEQPSGAVANTIEHVADTTEQRPDIANARRATPPGAVGYYLVAAASLTVSVDTSWRFFRDVIGITNVVERSAMFGIVELALIAAGFGMASAVRRTGRPGPSQVFAWSLCGFAGYMAWQLSGLAVGVARVGLGPVIGLLALHLALGIERRTHHARTGVWARIGRELRERMLSRLGLSDDERDAARRTRDRAARRVARLSLGQRVWLREARLARALAASDVAQDETMRGVMLAELATRRHAGALATLVQPSPWSEHRTD